MLNMSVGLDNSNIGFMHEVTNQKGVTSYLIGTVHLVDLETVRHPSYEKTIKKCSVLFTEIGTSASVRAADGCLPGTVRQDNPELYCLDIRLTWIAWCYSIPIKSLDHSVPEMAEELSYYDAARKADDEYEERRFHDWKTTPGIDNFISKFKQGNGEEFARSNYFFEDAQSNIREKKWAELLVPQLLETDKPIGIVVGAYHVIGKDSLSDRFAKAGLKVELIAPSITFKSRL